MPQKLTLEDMQKLAQKHSGRCLSSKYTNTKTKLKWVCKNNHTWLAAPDLTRDQWCPHCAGNAKGDIESMPRPFRRTPSPATAGPPSEGATVVKISVGQDSGIEFSDRTVLRTDVPLDSAYLILRESVVSSHLIEKRQQIELSSGYFLPLGN